MISSALLAIALAALSVNGSPVPQGETRLLSPSNGPIPATCNPSYQGMFAIAAVPATNVPNPTTLAARQVSQQPDGQPTVGKATVPVATQISDAQPQLPTNKVPVITQISDAQPQAPMQTMMPVSQIFDGQPQAYYSVPVVTQISDAQPQAPTNKVPVVTQISDAQPQAPKPTANPVTQISDAQPQAPKPTVPAVTQISDAQPQVSNTGAASSAAPTSPAKGSSGGLSTGMVACKAPGVLTLDVQNGRLIDGQGRIGYIAANYQFQFDAGVPQTGAIITTGFNVCNDGTLGLGGSNVFWQCLSGTFYNLYDRKWAPQCSPVYLRAVQLIDC